MFDDDSFDRDSRASDRFYDDNDYADYDIADVEGYYPGRDSKRRQSGNTGLFSSSNRSSRRISSSTEGTTYQTYNTALSTSADIVLRCQQFFSGSGPETIKIEISRPFRLYTSLIALLANIYVFIVFLFDLYPYSALPYIISAICPVALILGFGITQTFETEIPKIKEIYQRQKKLFIRLTYFSIFNICLTIAGLILTDYTIFYFCCWFLFSTQAMINGGSLIESREIIKAFPSSTTNS